MRRVMAELTADGQMFLRFNSALEVIARPSADFSVWAYFPVHRRRRVVRELAADGIRLKPTTRVLLLIGEKQVKQQSSSLTDAELRDHLGHTLLYLRKPRANNECKDALREWDAWRSQ
jgi:hypothetical protein